MDGRWTDISIHALREEGDGRNYRPAAPSDISIHALREEGDTHYSRTAIGYRLFLSTPSARRATGQLIGLGDKVSISIHALREEGDRA